MKVKQTGNELTADTKGVENSIDQKGGKTYWTDDVGNGTVELSSGL